MPREISPVCGNQSVDVVLQFLLVQTLFSSLIQMLFCNKSESFFPCENFQIAKFDGPFSIRREFCFQRKCLKLGQLPLKDNHEVHLAVPVLPGLEKIQTPNYESKSANFSRKSLEIFLKSGPRGRDLREHKHDFTSLQIFGQIRPQCVISRGFLSALGHRWIRKLLTETFSLC